MMAREHINHAWGLDKQIRYVFRNDSVRLIGWPLKKAPLCGRVFTIYQIKLARLSA